MIAEPMVIGMTISKSSLSLSLVDSIMTVDFARFSSRRGLYLLKITNRTIIAAIIPAEAPKVAPAAASSRFVLKNMYARKRPVQTLTICSMTWDTAVGVMIWCPWKYPLRDAAKGVNIRAMDMALIEASAPGFPMNLAIEPAPKKHMKNDTRLIARVALSATLYDFSAFI